MNIGDVNFGLDAQTEGLRKAIQQLNAFESAVNKAASAQQKGAMATATAMAKQESAIKGALQQSLALRQQLQRAGAPATELSKVTTAFRVLTREMTSGKLTTVEYMRSLDAFQNRLGRSRRALQGLRDERAGQSVHKLSQFMRNLESASVLAVGPLSGIGARIRSLGAITNRTNLTMAAFIGTLSALTLGFGILIASSVHAGIAWEQNIARIRAVTGSLESAQKEMNYVINTSSKLSTRILDNVSAYSKLTAAAMGTRLEGQATRDVFEGISTAVAALQLNQDSANGTFRAVEQMMSKGVVQAEELVSQLGERLPGAMQLAARAMNMSTMELRKMMEQGQLVTEVFLPKFATLLKEVYGEAALRNADSFAGAQARVANESFLLSKQLDNIFKSSTAVKGALNGVADILNSIRTNMDKILPVIGAVAGALVALAAPTIVTGIAFLTGTLYNLAKSILFIGMASNLSGINSIAGVIIKIGVAGAGAAGGFLLMQKMIKEIDFLMGGFDDTIDNTAGTLDQQLTPAFMKYDAELAELVETLSTAERVNDQMAKSFNQGTPKNPTIAKYAEEVRIALEKFKPHELDELTRRLHELFPEQMANDQFPSIVDAIANITWQTEQANRSMQQWISEWESTPDLVKSTEAEIEGLTARLAALRGGAKSLEVFENVTVPVQKFAEALKKSALSMQDQFWYTVQYENLLKQVAKAEEMVSNHGQQMGDAVANSLEDMLFKVTSVKEGLKDLGRELIKIAMRKAIFDPLANTLGGGISSGLTALGIPGFATGGEFEIGGGGAVDSKLIAFRGTPGETVTIDKQGKKKGKNGGNGMSLAITVNAPNADATVVARIKEMIMNDVVPATIRAATQNTMAQLKRPKFA